MAAALVAPSAAPAQHSDGLVYLRSRTEGNFHHHAGWTGPGAYGGYGFYQPWIAPPVVAGSWYSRPYPYHFDYYRVRWDAAPALPPACDCPEPPPTEHR